MSSLRSLFCSGRLSGICCLIPVLVCWSVSGPVLGLRVYDYEYNYDCDYDSTSTTTRPYWLPTTNYRLSTDHDNDDDYNDYQSLLLCWQCGSIKLRNLITQSSQITWPTQPLEWLCEGRRSQPQSLPVAYLSAIHAGQPSHRLLFSWSCNKVIVVVVVVGVVVLVVDQ